MPEIPTKPYLVRALFDWCNDSGYTPHVAVAVGADALVPVEYVKDGEIVLNVSPLATNRLTIGNEWLEFQARFGGVARDVRVPVASIRAIYARETGQGMAFEVAAPEARPAEAGSAAVSLLRAPAPGVSDEPPPEPPVPAGPGERPRLTRVK